MEIFRFCFILMNFGHHLLWMQRRRFWKKMHKKSNLTYIPEIWHFREDNLKQMPNLRHTMVLEDIQPLCHGTRYGLADILVC